MSESVGVQGKDVLVFIAATDTADPTMIEVEHQGDATYSDGKTTETVVNKNGKLVYVSEAGETIEFSLTKTRPLLPGQARVLALAGTGQSVKVAYDDPNSGGIKREGLFAVSVGQESANTEGLLEVPVTLLCTSSVTETVNT